MRNGQRRTLSVLLLVLSAAPCSGQLPAPKSNRTSRAAQTKVFPLPTTSPQTIRLGNTEIPLTQVVPNSEVALKRLQGILAAAGDTAVPALTRSLEALSARAESSRDPTLYFVRNARSVVQLSETRILWWRDWQELETLNAAVRSYVQLFTSQQQQIREIQENWSLPSQLVAQTRALPPPAAPQSSFPQALLQRIQQVQQTAALADAAVRSALESLVQLQVRISDCRTTVENVLREIDAAERRLHAGIFVLDSPPFWAALRGTSYASLRAQALIIVRAVRPRSQAFYSSHRYSLLAYFLLLLVMAAILFGLRQAQRGQAQELPTASRLLQAPFSVALFMLLFLFAIFFPQAPPEVIRFSQFVLLFPLLRIALAVFERPLKRPVLAFAIFFALDVLTVHIAAGTLFRRLLLLVVAVGCLATLAWVLRKSGPVRPLLTQKMGTVAPWFAHLAFLCLAVSVLANLVGCVALADLLLDGTLRSGYSAMSLYIMCLLLACLAAVLSTTRLGQVSRLVRLHRDLVLARFYTILKAGGWLAWLISILFAYQIAYAAFVGLRSALGQRWTIGAVSISLQDISLFFLLVAVAVVLARAIRFFLEEELFPRTRVSIGAAQSGSRLVHYALVLIGFFLALAAAGLDLGRLTLLTGAFGVGLGFGLQNLVADFVSGIIISLECPMQVGDTIEVGQLLGRVTVIGFRSSTVRTADGAEVIVPNSRLVGNSLVNWSLTDELCRGELRVGVTYGSDPARVIEILRRITRSNAAVLQDPEPLITFEKFGDGGLEFCLRFWTRIENLVTVRSELNLLMAKELGKEGLLVSLPQRDSQVRTAA